ncbi:MULTISPECIES: phosphatase PAP2 family protein [unclassified Blastococcus]
MTETVAVSGTRAPGDLLGTPQPAATTAGPARRTRVARLLRPAGVPWWFEFVLLYGLYRFYSHVRNGVGEVHSEAYANADAILRFEDAWGLAWERGLNALAHGSDALRSVVALHYASFHLYLTPVVLIWLYRRRRAHYRLASNVWMGTTFFALVGFYLWPTAPPRLVPAEGFVDVMRLTSSWGWWPTSGSPASNAISNQFAAMPSLHCAWAAWCGIVVFLLVRRPWVRVLAVLYPLTTFVVVMATGNHYLLDVVAGVGLLVLVGGVLLLGTRHVRARRVAAAAG